MELTDIETLKATIADLQARLANADYWRRMNERSADQWMERANKYRDELAALRGEKT